MNLGEQFLGHPNLIALLRFEDNLNDSKGSNFFQYSPTWPLFSNRFGKSIYLTGYYTPYIYDSTPSIPYNGPATVSMWIRNMSDRLFAQEEANVFYSHHRGVEIIKYSGGLRFQPIYNPGMGGWTPLDFGSLYPSLWYFIVFTWDQNNAKLYVNSKLIGTVSDWLYEWVQTASAATRTIICGPGLISQSFMLDELAIYNAYDCLSTRAQRLYYGLGKGKL